MLFPQACRKWMVVLTICILFSGPLGELLAPAQNVNLRVMAANLNDGSQTIEDYAIRTFQGLKPDVVAIQEFNRLGNTPADFRAFVDQAFGTEFVYYREGNYQIPNGIISRYPFIQTGRWADPEVSNRGFAWARIDIPGTNDLYVVSVHFLTSGATARAAEANALKSLILANFPSEAWIVVAGDFNAGSRTEAAVTTFNSFLSDDPVPTDGVVTQAYPEGNDKTNNSRQEPYDYVLVSYSLTNRMTNAVVGGRSFPNGLVFDSRLFTPLANVPPVLQSDSSTAQHMAVLKDFHIIGDTNAASGAPWIAAQPQSRTNAIGESTTFTVSANGNAPLTYYWRFNNTVLAAGASANYTISSVQTSNAGPYTVIVSNSVGSITSSVATLTVTLPAPYIIAQPQNQSVTAGATAVFSVNAGGALPLSYQWRSNAVSISGANLTNYTITNVQASAQANYSVVITNQYGSVTSAPAALAIIAPSTGTTGVLAGWNMYGQTGYGVSPMAPTTFMAGLTVGSLTRGAGIKTLNTASANSWGGNETATASAADAITAVDYVTCSITPMSDQTVSFDNVSAFTCRRSDTGARSGVLQYQVGSGSFTSITTLSFNSTSPVSLAPINLANIAALQNIAPSTTVTFRLVLFGATSTGGNWYFADADGTSAPEFALFGRVNPIPATPASPPLITNPSKVGNNFQFQVTGTPTSNYVVEATTTVLGGWAAVATNPAPFTYTDTNAGTTPRKFFRGRVAQ